MSPRAGLIRAQVTERLVAALVPVRTGPSAAAAPARSSLPQQASTLLHGVAPLDPSSRLFEARLFAALG